MNTVKDFNNVQSQSCGRQMAGIHIKTDDTAICEYKE